MLPSEEQEMIVEDWSDGQLSIIHVLVWVIALGLLTVSQFYHKPLNEWGLVSIIVTFVGFLIASVSPYHFFRSAIASGIIAVGILLGVYGVLTPDRNDPVRITSFIIAITLFLIMIYRIRRWINS